MKKITGLGLLVVGSVVCVGFFQNCSKIATQDLAAKTMDLSVTASGQSAPLVGSSTSTMISTIDETPAAGQVTAQEVKAEEIKSSEVKAVPTEVKVEPVLSQPKSGEVVAVVKIDQDKEDEDKEDEDKEDEDKDKKEIRKESDAFQACLEKDMKNSLTGSSFMNLHGKYKIQSNQIAEISDNHGKFLVHAASGRTHIDKISQFHGKLILCNADVDLIEKVHGDLILVNSRVRMIMDHDGVVKSVNSVIQKFDGKFKMKSF